jgi:hypothetical protein
MFPKMALIPPPPRANHHFDYSPPPCVPFCAQHFAWQAHPVLPRALPRYPPPGSPWGLGVSWYGLGTSHLLARPSAARYTCAGVLVSVSWRRCPTRAVLWGSGMHPHVVQGFYISNLLCRPVGGIIKKTAAALESTSLGIGSAPSKRSEPPPPPPARARQNR